MISAVGVSSDRCQPAEPLIGETVRVNCWRTEFAVSASADATFVFVMLTKERSGRRLGYALMDDSALLAAGGSLTLPAAVAYNSTGGGVRVTRTGLGEYDVDFLGFAGGSSSPRFGVHVVDQDEDDSAVCSIFDWTVTSPNLRVRVKCFEHDGFPDDDAFFIFVID